MAFARMKRLAHWWRMDQTTKPHAKRLKEIATLFLKLGSTAFGGPAAHIAMIEDEIVRRRRWLTHGEFLDLIGAVNLIPGPNSTEMAIHIGYRRAGWQGLLTAGVCFILPAMLIVLAFAWAYVRFGRLPQAAGFLYGIKPVIIAIVVQALWGLGRTAIRTKLHAGAAVAAMTLSFIGVNEMAVLFGAGVAIAILSMRAPGNELSGIGAMFLPFVPKPMIVAAGMPFGVWKLFLFFLKVGSILYGSGYVLLAFLRADLVERWGWLTERQLLDAIAIGQLTPGPVFTTATFIGYVLGGFSGAIAATIGIFLPAFLFVAISGLLVPRIRRSRAAGAFLDGVNIASLALMAAVAWRLSLSAIVDWLTLLLGAVAGLLLFRYRVNSVWLITGGAIFGFLKTFFA